MAGKKIGELTPLGRNLIATDELELSLAGSAGSRKITGQEIIDAVPMPIVMYAESANITHNGNQDTGKTTFATDPWSSAPQKVFGFRHALLPNDEIFYVFNVEGYTGFEFQYDNFTYNSPTEITIDNDAVLNSSIQLYGVGYTVNFNGRYFHSVNNLQGRGLLNFPNCLYIDTLEGSGSPFTSILFPKLIASNYISFSGGVEAMDLSELVYTGSLQLNYMNGGTLLTLDFPKLKVINNDLYLYNNPYIQELNLPSLVYANSISIDACGTLTNLIISSKLVMKEQYQKFCNVSNTPLNTESVDGLLIALDNAGQYNGQINLTSLCSAPSAAGVLAKDNLISKFWSVSTY